MRKWPEQKIRNSYVYYLFSVISPVHLWHWWSCDGNTKPRHSLLPQSSQEPVSHPLLPVTPLLIKDCEGHFEFFSSIEIIKNDHHKETGWNHQFKHYISMWPLQPKTNSPFIGSNTVTAVQRHKREWLSRPVHKVINLDSTLGQPKEYFYVGHTNTY